MDDPKDLFAPGNGIEQFPFSREDWEKTPHSVRSYVLELEHKIAQLNMVIGALGKRVDELETRLNRNSSNSNQPPSTDSPFKKKPDNAPSKRPGAKKGHKGHRQVMLEPGKTEHLKP